MVQGKWYPMGGDLTQPAALRRRIFGRGLDDLDAQAWQVVALRGEEPVGTARLWWRDGAFWLGDVGVLAEARRQGFGDLLVRLLLFKALTHSARVIRLSCSEETAPFFARYGFTADPNESPEEGAPIVMSIRGADVRLSGCGGACDGCGRRGEESKP